MDTYEKKYNEALERAQKATRAGSDVAMDIVQYIFPELRESEDERIRKALVSLVEELQRSDKYFSGVALADMLAWLEKQKEQKPVDYEAEFKKCKDNPLYFYDKYVSIKQKPAEWSEEDENALIYLHELIGFGFTEKFCDAQTASDMRMWLNTRLKSLRPSWKPSEEDEEPLSTF